MLAVSSERQAETLPHQRAMAEQIAASKGWTLERVVGEGREGVGSGKRGVRAILVAIIADLYDLPPAARPAWLWMRRVDRVGRGRAAESMLALHEIADLGVRIWDHDAGEVRLDTAEGEIIAGLKAGLARLENEIRAKKSRAALERKRKAGIPIGKVPYGLVRGADQQYVASEPQAAAVRTAFAMCIEGAGSSKIARHLALTAPPYTYTTGERPVRWDTRRVIRLLRNEAYAGTVVDEVTFERARRARTRFSQAPKQPRYDWPLTGALRCWCGRNMIGKSSGRPGGRWRYYICGATWSHGGKMRFVRAPDLEDQFVELLADLQARPDLVAHYRRRDEGPSLVMLDRTLRESRRRLEQIAKARQAVWELFETGKLRAEDVQERLDSFAPERERITEEIAELERQRGSALIATADVADAAALISRASEAWAAATPEERREIAMTVAISLGGFCAEESGELGVRYPEDSQAQANRRARGVSASSH